MHTLHRSTLYLALSLSALAGFVDAIGFLAIGGHFVSFMSGNSTQFAVGVLLGDNAKVQLLGGILACFVLGVVLGALVSQLASPRLRVVCILTLVACLLLAAALVQNAMPMLSILLITLAMGAENAVFQRAGDIAIGLTYMTGTLVKMGQRLAGSLLGREPAAWQPYFLLWLALVTGGVLGAFCFSAMGLQGLWIAVMWTAGLALLSRLIPAIE